MWPGCLAVGLFLPPGSAGPATTLAIACQHPWLGIRLWVLASAIRAGPSKSSAGLFLEWASVIRAVPSVFASDLVLWIRCMGPVKTSMFRSRHLEPLSRVLTYPELILQPEGVGQPGWLPKGNPEDGVSNYGAGVLFLVSQG